LLERQSLKRFQGHLLNRSTVSLFVIVEQGQEQCYMGNLSRRGDESRGVHSDAGPAIMQRHGEQRP
jgi:hypothetical protein